MFLSDCHFIPLHLSLPFINHPHWFQFGSSFYLNADMDPDLGCITNVVSDPDPGQALKSKKVNFYMKNI
jgi:hypothetical protein